MMRTGDKQVTCPRDTSPEYPYGQKKHKNRLKHKSKNSNIKPTFPSVTIQPKSNFLDFIRDNHKTFIVHFWRFIVALSVIVTIISGLTALKSNISIIPTPSVSQGDPFQSAFLIKNDSYFPVYDVKFSYIFNNIEGYHTLTADMKHQRVSMYGGIGATSKDDLPPLKHLLSGEETSLIFPQGFFEEYTYCDIVIKVFYRPSFFPFHKSENFRFVTRHTGNQLSWFPKSESEPIYFSPDVDKGLQLRPSPSADPSKIILHRKEPLSK